MNLKNLSSFQNSLLKWYQSNKRPMPWRQTSDPYQIWVSEIMLQQTQVDTVIPYYQKWVKKFPTVKSLAKSQLSSALKLWAGLGYYRRPRMLHVASKEVVKNHKGIVPNSFEQLIKLPGIGRYTAGAILSIAFNKPAAILDGNLKRIFARIFASHIPIDTPKGEKYYWSISEKIIHAKHPGDFNQALMELGATVCFPFNPQCGLCPVAKHCKAQKAKTELNYPVVKRKEKLKRLKTAALICKTNGKILIQKQPKEGRWGGLWMFPFWENKEKMTLATKINIKNLHKKMTVKHGFTKYLINLEVFENNSATKTQLSGKWVKVENLNKFAFPAPHQKIVKELI